MFSIKIPIYLKKKKNNWIFFLILPLFKDKNS